MSYVDYLCVYVLNYFQLFVTLWTVPCQAALSMGFSQARILEWIAISSSRCSSWPRNWTLVSSISCIGTQILYHWATWGTSVQFSSVAQSCPTLCDPMDCQASLSITNSWSLLKLMSIELVMPSNHFILCCLLLIPPSMFPRIRVFSNESVLHIR